jgi:hypothetical protein
MDAAKLVYATFNLAPNVKIVGGTHAYEKIEYAYSAASPDTIILARAREFIENLLLNRAVAVTIKGGYDPTFTDTPGMTELKGTLTIRKGSLVVDRLTIR